MKIKKESDEDKMEINNNPVAVFDSGFGGISVLRELRALLPNENYIYMGDSKNAPYGTKDTKTVRQLTQKCIDKMVERGAKAVVIACNTATSAAITTLREEYTDIPIIGMEPALKPAVLYKKNSRIIVMATPMTLREEKFYNLMESYKDQATIIKMPCPKLVEFVERGELKGANLEIFLTNFLKNFIDDPADSIVLGCTHYPFVKDTIQKIVGNQTKIFDGGKGTAKELKRKLELSKTLNTQNNIGTVTFFNSSQDPNKIELSKLLLNAVN